MATYKVIQDIEAEDKFLGPLTLKQFIFGATAIFFTYLSVYAVSQQATFLLALFIPPAFLGAFLAIPWSKDQPTEVWVLAKLRFRVKSKSRIWDQAGLEELVTITAPKKIEKVRTNGLNQDEVASRLKALAETIDTRGWATKNANLYDHMPDSGDRLISPSMMPREVPDIDINAYHDVLDEDTAVSDNFNQMMQTSNQSHRQQSLDKMERVRHGESIDSVQQFQQPNITFTPPANGFVPEPVFDEQQLSQQLRYRRNAADLANGNMRTLPTSQASTQTTTTATVQPAAQQPYSDVSDTEEESAIDNTAAIAAAEQAVLEAQAAMTKGANPAILKLAQNNDLDIATIARQAQRNDNKGEREVVVSLR